MKNFLILLVFFLCSCVVQKKFLGTFVKFERNNTKINDLLIITTKSKYLVEGKTFPATIGDEVYIYKYNGGDVYICIKNVCKKEVLSFFGFF